MSSDSDPSPSDVAAALVGELMSGGEHVDEGGFTLDPAKALEKLRGFQLAEREAWVLLLVEAASLAAERARIAVWAGESMVIDLVGPALSAAQLESVFHAPFADLSELEDDARAVIELQRLLALALNAALALESEGLEVDAVDREGQAHRMTLGRDGSPRVQTIDGAKPGVVIVRRRGEGMSGQQQSAREIDLVRERCRYARFPVLCDGVRISAGPEAIVEHGGPRRPIEDRAGDAIGVGTLTGESGASQALIVVRGVLVETYRDDERWRADFRAVVAVDHLRTDLGANQVIRDAEFEAVIAAIDQVNDQFHDQAALVRREPNKVAKVELSMSSIGSTLMLALILLILFALVMST